jgi:hypothetical protein
MYNIKEILPPPVKVGEVKDPRIYYQGHAGATLTVAVFNGNNHLIARGHGLSWNEQPQLQNYMEWNQRHCLEIIKGAMLPGNISIQALTFFHLNDSLPTASDLADPTEFTALIQLGDKVESKLLGLVIDVFKGVNIGAQSGQFSATSQYFRTAQLIYRYRMNGLQWAQQNKDLFQATSEHGAYPATAA